MSFVSTAPTSSEWTGGSGLWRLLILFAPDIARRGVSRVLGHAVTIGRGATTDAHFGLDDAEASRVHARLERSGEGGRWQIADAGSRNGTFVDGRKITEPLELTGGNVIRIGAHVLLLQFLSAEDCDVMVAAPLDRRTLLGDSIGMMRVRLDIRTIGPSNRPVLVLGETGVGKELVAAELHRASKRTGPFVAVNCAALPENLVESELFGHAKGAFTGAAGKSDGLFGQAHGGTLFLDEIGEMPIALQPKLLRALATGEVRGVGETEARTVDVRVVAATNVDLAGAIDGGGFRADLYSRLMGAIVRIPPLRERRDDVLPLVHHFLGAAGRPLAIDPGAAEALAIHSWRFNVRELEQVVHRAALDLNEETPLRVEHLPPEIGGPIADRSQRPADAPPVLPLPLRVRRDAQPDAEGLREVLRHFGGNVAHVADYFGKDRRQVYRWAEQLGVEMGDYRE